MGEFNFAEELKKMPQTPGVYLMQLLILKGV